MSKTQTAFVLNVNSLETHCLMADVALLWFQCKNPDCNYIPVKTKKEKIQRYWKHGNSLQESKRPRLFMRYVEGNYRYLLNGDVIIFSCKYGDVKMYNTESELVNSYYYPIHDEELCQPCTVMQKNERAMFQ